MLTHEELMEKCQELQDAANLLMNAMHENGGIFNPDLKDHKYYMDNLIDTEDALLTVYLENRDNISDKDAMDILTTVMVSSNIEGFATGTDAGTPEGKIINVQWNELK